LTSFEFSKKLEQLVISKKHIFQKKNKLTSFSLSVHLSQFGTPRALNMTINGIFYPRSLIISAPEGERI
jgi:hypothetical protein